MVSRRIEVVFASIRDGNYDIFIMDADGSNPINLDPANDTDPSWLSFNCPNSVFTPEGKLVTIWGQMKARDQERQCRAGEAEES